MQSLVVPGFGVAVDSVQEWAREMALVFERRGSKKMADVFFDLEKFAIAESGEDELEEERAVAAAQTSRAGRLEEALDDLLLALDSTGGECDVRTEQLADEDDAYDARKKLVAWAKGVRAKLDEAMSGEEILRGKLETAEAEVARLKEFAERATHVRALAEARDEIDELKAKLEAVSGALRALDPPEGQDETGEGLSAAPEAVGEDSYETFPEGFEAKKTALSAWGKYLVLRRERFEPKRHDALIGELDHQDPTKTLKRIKAFASKDRYRTALCQILVEDGIAKATDGHRGCWIPTSWEDGHYSRGGDRIEDPPVFPSLDAIVPTEWDVDVFLDGKTVAKRLGVLGSLAREKEPGGQRCYPAKLTATGGEVYATATFGDLEDFTEVSLILGRGLPVSGGWSFDVNARYLKAAVRGARGALRIQISHKTRLVQITHEGGERHIISGLAL